MVVLENISYISENGTIRKGKQIKVHMNNGDVLSLDNSIKEEEVESFKKCIEKTFKFVN
ncbi:hypothetical protein V7O61_02430 [Methanolobus sp. WCC1]|uniref:hypothetical protein n=1 Tax=unclassified Methanolobus TaxID=2629569 RepID=UPI003245C36E